MSTTDVLKTNSERALQKGAETTGDLVGNKIKDKITRASSLKSECPHKWMRHLRKGQENVIPQEKRQQIINELDHYNIFYTRREWSIRK